MYKRISACLLLACLLLSLCGLCVTAKDTPPAIETIDQYVHDFNGAPLSNTFSDNSTGFGMSYAGGVRGQVVVGADGADDRAVRLSNADLRWWNVGYTGLSFGFSVDVLCDEGFLDTALYWCAQNHIASTSTESFNGGRVMTVQADESGEPAVYNYENEKQATLPRGRVVRLCAVFSYGEPGYTLYMDDTVLSEGNRFAENSAIYAVTGLKLAVESQTESSYITVDNVRAYTTGQRYPQPNSYQAPGDLPTVILPEAFNTDGVMIYANETYVATVPAPADGDTAPLLPLVDTLRALGATAEVYASGQVNITTERASFTLSADGKTLIWNEETVMLNIPAAVVDGTVYAPAQVFSEVLHAKVWYAEALGMLVISTGTYGTDHVLRAIGGSFWMNGEPYYEISYNKWDLSAQIAADARFNGGEYVSRSWNSPDTTIAGAERALKELSENGFKTIRIFASTVNPGRGQEAVDRLFAHTDFMYDLCDQYGIRVVPCLGLMDREFLDGRHVDGVGWVSGTETDYDLITDPGSQSRAWVYEFIDLYIDRYKDRDTILMWEIQNEGNLGADVASGVDATYSIGQLGDYYADVAARIKAKDPTRIVTGGDGLLRSAQWHLYAGVMAGMKEHDWTIDKDFERINALWTINRGVDAVSVHGYGVGYENNSGHAYYLELRGGRYLQRVVHWTLLMKEARRIGMPLYNGECGGMMDSSGKEISADNTSPEAADARVHYLDSLIEAGVQLTHWWAFRSDRADFGFDMDTWNVTIEGTPETFAAIKAANEKLQARYMVNPLAEDNSHILSEKEGDGARPAPVETSAETSEETTLEVPTESLPETRPDAASETETSVEESLTDSRSDEDAETVEAAAPSEAGGCSSRIAPGALWVLSAVGLVLLLRLCERRERNPW